MDLGVSLPETFGDIVVRIQHFIDDAKSLGEGSNILVVSHKITIVAAMVAVEQLPREAAKHFTVNNCEVFPVSL